MNIALENTGAVEMRFNGLV